MELGAGTTLATYSGICAADNLQGLPDPYFHIYSLHEFQVNFFQHARGTGCGLGVTTTNNRPTATVPGQCYIPKRTPFFLAGTGADPDANTVLSYTWEQVDPSPTQQALAVENKLGPLFRSNMPCPTCNAYNFPSMNASLLLATDTTPDPHQRLSSVARSLHFALTVRDNFNAAGGTSVDSQVGSWHSSIATVNVAAVGPLIVRSPAASTVQAGQVEVVYELSGYKKHSDTNSQTVKALQFGVEFSSDGGATWSTLSYPDSASTLSANGLGLVTVSLPNPGAGQQFTDARLRVYAVSATSQFTTGTGMFAKDASNTALSLGCAFWSPSQAITVTAADTVPTLEVVVPSGTSVELTTTSGALKFTNPVAVSGASGETFTINGVAASAISVSGKVVSFSLPALAASTTYSLTFTTGFFVDAYGRNPTASAWSITTSSGNLCYETCDFASDGSCDDGGPGAQYTSCAYGTDCTDCSARAPSGRRQLSSAISIVSTYPPQATLDVSGYPSNPPMEVLNPTVRANASINITFNQLIQIPANSTAQITIEECYWFDDFCHFHCNISASDALEVQTEFMSLIITPYINCRLSRNGQWRLRINGGSGNSPGVVEGVNGNSFGPYEYTFLTNVDNQPPYIVSTIPVNDAVGVDEMMQYTIRFNPDDIIFVDGEYGGTGAYPPPRSSLNFTLYGYFNGALVETITMSANDETLIDVFETEIVIWTEYAYYSNARYCLSIDANAIQDWTQNNYPGSYQAHCFNTTNTIAPILSDIRAVVMPGNMPVLNISFISLGPTRAGSYYLSIIDTATNVTMLSIDPSNPTIVTYHPMADAAPSADGNEFIVTLTLPTPLPGPANYALQYPAGAFKDIDENGVDPKSDNFFAFTVSNAAASCNYGLTYSTTGLSPCTACPVCSSSEYTVQSCTLTSATMCSTTECNPDSTTCTPSGRRRRRSLLFGVVSTPSVADPNVCCS